MHLVVMGSRRSDGRYSFGPSRPACRLEFPAADRCPTIVVGFGWETSLCGRVFVLGCVGSCSIASGSCTKESLYSTTVQPATYSCDPSSSRLARAGIRHLMTTITNASRSAGQGSEFSWWTRLDCPRRLPSHTNLSSNGHKCA